MGLFTKVGKSFGKILASFMEPIQQQQYDLERQSRQTYWQDNKMSLLNAGYNPLLQMGGGAQGLQISTPTDTFSSALGGSVTGALTSAQQFMQLNMNKKLNDATVEKTNEETETEKTMQTVNTAEAALKESEKILKDKEANWYDKKQALTLKQMSTQTIVNQATAAEIASAKELNEEKRKTEIETQKQKHEETRGIKARNELIGKTQSESGNSNVGININKGGVGINFGSGRSVSRY